MGQREMETFEKLLTMAFEAIEQSIIECNSIREHYIKDQMYEAEMAQRRSDKYYGYAQGIYQALVEMGYKHKDIERLREMLKWKVGSLRESSIIKKMHKKWTGYKSIYYIGFIAFLMRKMRDILLQC